MFSELSKYKNRGSFEFGLNDSLSSACNAPKAHGGIYLLYDITSSENLIIIGSSGWVNQDGTFGLRKDGMYDRLVNGKQSFIINKIEVNDKRKNVWPLKMKEDKIERLRIEWYVSFEGEIKDIPAFVEGMLIQRYFEKHNKLPSWNKDF